jgi:hypothetical protein
MTEFISERAQLANGQTGKPFLGMPLNAIYNFETASINFLEIQS